MISGPTHFEAAASTSRLRSTTSGTPSNTMPAPASAAAMFLRRHHGDPRDDGLGVIVRQQSEPRQACQRFADFAERLGFERRELLRGARLDVDHGDGVAGIGECHRDAAAHAAGAETGDRGGERRSSVKTLAQQGLQFVAIEVAETEACQRAPALHEILAADRAADGEK